MYQDVREAEIMPDACIRALNTYREDTDFFGQFVQDCLTIAEGEFLVQEQLLDIAKKWGQINNCKSMVNEPIPAQTRALSTHPASTCEIASASIVLPSASLRLRQG
jgi:hypothetical protein